MNLQHATQLNPAEKLLCNFACCVKHSTVWSFEYAIDPQSERFPGANNKSCLPAAVAGIGLVVHGEQGRMNSGSY